MLDKKVGVKRSDAEMIDIESWGIQHLISKKRENGVGRPDLSHGSHLVGRQSYPTGDHTIRRNARQDKHAIGVQVE